MPLRHRILREPLKMQIERRVDVDGLGRLRHRRKLLRERLADEVDEIGRLGIERARDGRERFLDRALGGIGRHETGVGHRAQHDVAALARARRRVERRQRAGRLNDAGDRGGLAEREIVDVLAEVQPRRLGDAVNRERPAIAEIDVVQIQLEHFVFGRPEVEDDRHELLEQLAAERALPRLLLDGHLFGEKEISGELLRDGAGAFQVRPVAEHVREERANHADGIDAGMRVVAPVFDREHRLHHPRGQRRERHLPALDARRNQRRQHRRVHA